MEIFADKKVGNISVQRRTSQGVRIIKLDAKDEVMSMAKVIEMDEEESANNSKPQDSNLTEVVSN